MSEGERNQSAQYLWAFGIKKLLRVVRSDIRMGHSDRVGDGVLYMQRLIVELGPGRRSFRLHVIHMADMDNCLHDHPWVFWSFVLWGGYEEEIPAPDYTPEEAVAGFPRRVVVKVPAGRFRRMPLHYKHRITRLFKKVSVTLAYAGPLAREWGFYTNEGWQHWEDFVDESANRILWCDIREV